MTETPDAPPTPTGTAAEVFAVFLRLGLTSFGGPVAHIGYFRDQLVERRRWLTEPAFAELLGLCQFLPGPASSQLGFALGLARAGPAGALAAWMAFTLPSALLMLALALLSGTLVGAGAAPLFHALKLVAVVVVAQAVWGMARTLTPDPRRAAIALAAAGIGFGLANTAGQLAAILTGAIAGLLWCRRLVTPSTAAVPILLSRRAGAICLALFGLLLTGLPVAAALSGSAGLHLADIFARAGALVFGGGHVVLPLLRADLVPSGLVDADRFLAGYGAAQALPGPLFAIAAYLGAVGGNGIGGGVLAIIAIFLPGLLLLAGVLPYWAAVRDRQLVRAAVIGVNAAVVGILALALYDPVWTGADPNWSDIALIGIALAALLRWQLPPLAVIAALVVGALLLA